jgi:hypothetical protein
MGICAADLRDLVIRPTLLLLNEWSPTAENLLMGTAAQESQLGFRMHSDPLEGLGLYRISAQAHLHMWDKYLVTDPELASRLRGLASQQQFLKNPHNELITNLSYASGTAWMIYKQHQIQLPEKPSVQELAELWVAHYCSRNEQNAQPLHNQKPLTEQFIQNYHKLVLREQKNLAA